MKHQSTGFTMVREGEFASPTSAFNGGALVVELLPMVSPFSITQTER